MGHILKFSTAGAPKEIAPRTYTFIASTADLDRDGDIIEPSGWRLASYLGNPVILVQHNAAALPVARASRVEVVRGRLEVDVHFPEPGTSAAADEAHGLVRQGFLRAVSVGFLPLAGEPIKGGRGTRWTAVELLEVSLVSLPSNPAALAAAYQGATARKTVPDAQAAIIVRAFAEGAADAVKKAMAPKLTAAEAAEVIKTTITRVVNEEVRKRLAHAMGRLD
jgi:HK97 family phage prohead protease